MRPRFVLILSIHSNLVRAALVTRELKIVSSAQQAFTLHDNHFDPAEVWYKTKQVIAACLDIGRTLAREIAGLALVTQEQAHVRWREQGKELVAEGLFTDGATANARGEQNLSGTLSAWLLWNLTGVFLETETRIFGNTRARAPFDAELPVILLQRQEDALAHAGSETLTETERVLVGAARCAWEMVSP
jgi:glycerol kinase